MSASQLWNAVPARNRNLSDLLQRQSEVFGEREFVRFEQGGSWTFAEARDRAARWAGAMRQAGIEKGDRVAVICSNRIEFLEVYFGCAWAGAVTVPINTASRGMQLQHILNNCGAKLLVVEDEFLGSIDTIDRSTLALEMIWAVGSNFSPSGEIQARPPIGEPIPPAPSGPGDVVAISYTSGTTGPSKGVCCPHAHLFWWGLNTADLLGLGERERLFTTLPLFHVNALNTAYQALLTGSAAIFAKRFSVSGFQSSLAESGATATYLLGAMVPMLLSRPETALDRQHNVRIALGPGVPSQFHQPFRERFGFHLIEAYGSTETNLVIGCGVNEAKPGTMGKVRQGFHARVVDEDDKEVAPGEAGELVLRNDIPFAFSNGYYGMPEKTVEAWRNLWFHSGDRVIRDSDGYFRFVDRLKDAIRRRGENVSSYEVEQVLLSHPHVAAAAVFPVPSEMAEDEVMAAVILKDQVELAEAELIEFCQNKMPYFALPRYLEFVNAFPMTENGKPQKFKLRERGVTPLTWDREAHGISAR